MILRVIYSLFVQGDTVYKGHLCCIVHGNIRLIKYDVGNIRVICFSGAY